MFSYVTNEAIKKNVCRNTNCGNNTGISDNSTFSLYCFICKFLPSPQFILSIRYKKVNNEMLIVIVFSFVMLGYLFYLWFSNGYLWLGTPCHIFLMQEMQLRRHSKLVLLNKFMFTDFVLLMWFMMDIYTQEIHVKSL